jgi:hypothetical protein
MAQITKRSTAEQKFNELMSNNSLSALETKLKLTHILIDMGYKEGLNDPQAKEVYITAVLSPHLYKTTGKIPILTKL